MDTFDLILKNCNIITMDAKESRGKWVGVQNGKIAEIGYDDNCPEGANELDLNGSTVLPGLFDSHCHVMTTGFYLASIDLIKTRSIDEVLSCMDAECRRKPEGDWVFGGGFASYLIEEERFPNRFELDSISNGHPIMISTQTLHGCVLNTKAMEMVEIPADAEGVIRNDEGIPTGVFMADEIVFSIISKVMNMIPEEQLWNYITGCAEYAAAHGVTTMGGLMGQFVEGDKDVHLALMRGGELPVDIEIFYQTWDIEKVKALGLQRIGGCLTLDGAGFEYTMALQEPYPERPERRGFLIHTDEEIYRLISSAHKEGIQCAFHALGDRAIDQLIYLYQQVILEQGWKDLRHRIEHFSLPSDKHMDMLSQYKLIASMQPAFPGLWGQPGSGIYVPMLGRERADRMEVFPEIIRRGGIICGGSDSPVTLVNPLYGIASCVNNPDPRRNVSVTDAIKIFTINSAYAVGKEKEKGSIEIGKNADFTVVDKNPYDIFMTQEIYQMKVLYTIKNGKFTFSLDGRN